LTFTKKSSQEMLRRATQVLDHRCEQVSGGTFHSFANIVLRHYGEVLGYSPGFTILDRSDADELIGLVRGESDMKTDKRFPKKATIGAMVSMAVNTGQPLGTVLNSDYPQYIEYESDILQIANRYQLKKREMQVMDYDDLLTQFRALLNDHPAVRDELRTMYRYIMVDEYQDTNTLQSDIIRRLANEHSNVMVVGDDSQSIYSFRGASFKNIIEFPTLFDGTRIIKLEQNYRSSQPILNLTNALIDKAREKYSKTLFTQRPEGELPVYIEAGDENTQSRFVSQKILEFRESGVSLNDMAVLVRSGWHSNDLEVELQTRNIPFQKFGGFKFVESAHVKDVISYLKVIQNPNDVVAWSRLLQLIDGVGPKTVSQFLSAIPTMKRTSVLSSLFIGKKYSSDLQALVALVAKKEGFTPSKLIEIALTHYSPLFRLKYDDYGKRVADLESIKLIAARYQTLDTFLAELSLEPPDQTQIDTLAGQYDDERITISTIHSAKGLEWKVVFLISVVDGYIPSFQSLGDLSQLEEERRLLYVALTRAKDHLFIIKPNLDGAAGSYHRYPGVTFSKLSRFLDDYQLLEDLAEKWVIKEESRPTKFGFRRNRPAIPQLDADPPEFESHPEPSPKKYFF
ncbi:ATP-dependent helicase, partial [bacterium]|nr:ATP-dependent helicase [bacterium]